MFVQISETFGLLVKAEVGIGLSVAGADGADLLVRASRPAFGDAFPNARVRRVHETTASASVADDELIGDCDNGVFHRRVDGLIDNDRVFDNDALR